VDGTADCDTLWALGSAVDGTADGDTLWALGSAVHLVQWMGLLMVIHCGL
jgi:hypothetical protein